MDEVKRVFESFDAVGALLKAEQSIMDKVQTMTLTQSSIFLGGVLLFFAAKSIAHRALTFYLSGAAFGVLFSIAYLAMFIRRLLPTSVFMIPLDLIGVPALSFLYYYGYNHAQDILSQNWKWLMIYVVVAITISLIVCYVSDFSSNVRVKNVLQWMLQFIAVLLMLFSSQHTPLVAGAVLFMLAIDWGVHRYPSKFIKWLKKKPEIRSQLTVRECDSQNADFTENELEKLQTLMLENLRYNLSERALAKQSMNREQLVNFLVTSHNISIQALTKYQKELKKPGGEFIDNGSPMEVDENLLLSDADH